MITFPHALELLLDATPPLGVEPCRIEHAAGRVLREAVHSDRPFPPFDRVMMDGYAFRSVDLAITCRLRVTGSAPAGQPAVELAHEPFTCVEVMTGAPLPLGADCIVPVEEITRADEGEISIRSAFEASAGRFIHRAGSDAPAGALVLEAGRQLGSRETGAAASCGAAWLTVSRLPEIAVVATGDELVEVDETPQAHQIRQSNAHALACALTRAGYPPSHVGTLGDDAAPATEGLRALLRECGWLVLTGAVSRGSRDFIPMALETLGCTRIFHGVAQRPGKPAGCWRGPAGQIVMALPGNPVSALTNLHAFVLPALAAASGMSARSQRLVVPLAELPFLSGMTHHLPVKLAAAGSAIAAATGNSGDFIGLLTSDGFLTLPPREPGHDPAAAQPFTAWI